MTAESLEPRKLCGGCYTVNQQTAAFCYACGLSLPAETVPASRAFGNPAGLRARSVAFLIDLLLVGGAWAIAYAALTDTAVSATALRTDMGGEPLALAGVWLGFLAYSVIGTAAWGRTLGKLVMGLRVMRSDGGDVGWRRSLARFAAYHVSALPAGLGFMAVSLGPRRRGWHDLLCDTQVLKVRPR